LARVRASLAVGAGHGVRKVHSHYHIPISNTAAGLIALEKF
jgi:protocatechuate 4,5-dioxygenase beta chain